MEPIELNPPYAQTKCKCNCCDACSCKRQKKKTDMLNEYSSSKIYTL